MGEAPVMVLGVDSGSLHALRAQMRDCARRAGLPDGRIEDVVLAAHELAANVVRHGGGTGWLRVWCQPGLLRFQVDNGQLPLADGPDGASADGASADGASAGGASAGGAESDGAGATRRALPCVPGHGLWVVQQVADQMQSWSGPDGTTVVAVFGAPQP
jgi:anti-sigma regulatory factor (Ser/Thr protein kinase)